MATAGYQSTATVLHRGIVFAFTASNDPSDTTIYYNVLDLDIESTSDALDWSGFRELEFPDHLRTVGMGLITVPMSTVTTGGVAHGQFKVLSDQQYVYVFRRSLQDTLYCTRFAMVEEPGARDSDEKIRSLRPAWEVRFQRSGKRDVPAGARDVPAYADAAGDHFVEPTLELSMIEGVGDGGFAIVLVPAQVDDRPRWQIFGHDKKTGRITMFSFGRDENGLFDVSGKKVDPTTKTIPPDATFTVTMKDGGKTVPLEIVTGLTATVYYKQERATTGGGEEVGLKRNARVLLAFGIEPKAPAAPATHYTATLDFAVSRDGTLAGIEPATVLGRVDPADHTLYFDGNAYIALADEKKSLELTGSFTLELWLLADELDSETRRVVGNSAAPTAERPPYLTVGDGAIHAGFGGNDLATPGVVLQRGAWNHVAATFDATTGAMTVYVNGAVQTTATWTGRKPPGKPLAYLGAPESSFLGNLDEVRVWKVARSQRDLVEHLYQELPDPKSLPDLVGYWTFDEVEAKCDVQTTPDSSSSGNTGTLHGPRIEASTSPVAPASAAELQIDDAGLTVEAGYLEFAQPASTPFLLDGVDGLVHLYYQSDADLLTVAQYDSAIARAIYYLPWKSPDPRDAEEGGGAAALALVAHRAGTLMNGCEISVEPTVASRADLCTLEARTRQDVTETWRGLPRRLERFAAVLGGEAVGDPSDPRLKSGTRTFYDYAGNHPTSWLEAGGGFVLAITRRPKARQDEDGKLDPDPGGLDLANVAITGAGAETCTVALTFQPADGGAPILQVWPEVPVAVGKLVATLNAVAPAYDYAAPGAGTPPIYSLAAGASTLLLLGRRADLTAATLTVAAGTGAERCKVTVALTAGKDELTFEVADVARDQNDVAAALRAATQQGGAAKLADYLFASADGLDVAVADQVQRYGDKAPLVPTDGLRAAASIFEVIVDGATGALGDQDVAAAVLQGAATSDVHADLTDGSALFGAAPVSVPTSGQVAEIQDTRDAELWQPGVAGGWLAEPPRFAVAFEQNDLVVDLDDDKAHPLYIRGDLSLEAWIDPTGSSSAPNPRVITYNKIGDVDDVDDYARYMLGVSESAYLLITGADNMGTIVGVLRQQGELFGATAYTVQLWVQPDLSTITRPGQIWLRQESQGAAVSDTRLTVDPGGTLIVTINRAAGDPVIVRSTHAILTNDWSHVTVVRDAGTVTLYVDGAPAGSISGAPEVLPADSFLLGGNSGPELLQCGMNELRIWSRALTASEIAANLEAHLPGDAEGLTLRWPLTEGRDNVAFNTAQTGKIYNGQIFHDHLWRTPGVFYVPYAGSRRQAVRATAGVVPRAGWSHLAAVYDTACAIQLSGDAYGDCGNDPIFDFDQELGIDLWVTPARAGHGRSEVLVSKWGAHADGQSWELGLDPDGRPYLRVRMTDGGHVYEATAKGTAALSAGTPHHLAATLEMTSHTDDAPVPLTFQIITLRLFVDGHLVTTEEECFEKGNYQITRSTTAVQLGRTRPDETGPSAPFLQSFYAGAMSDVRLWARTLTAADAAVLAAPGTQFSDDGLIASWPFSEMDGTVAFDAAGTSNARLSDNDLWRLYDANAILQLYVDGAPVPTQGIVAADVDGYGDHQLRLAGMKNGGLLTDGWTGTIDEIRVWDRNLTREEITDSMNRPLAGNEDGLAGYWRFDTGSGRIVADQTGRGNDAVMEPNTSKKYPTWVLSTAPVNNEGPCVINAVDGLRTPAVATLTGPPATVDYPDVQRDVDGETFAVVKRLYMYVDTGAVTLETGFKLGDLNLIYIGQIQTSPKLIGYIEGAPPVPSENQTRPLYNDPHFNDYRFYATTSKVTLKQEEETVRSYSSTKRTGFDLSAELKAGFWAKQEVKAGPLVVHKNVVDLKGKIGLHGELEYSTGTETEQEVGGSRTRTISSSIDCGGEWEEAGPDGWLNPTVGRRFTPENNGYALVKSLTADLFAQTLKSTGALFGLTAVPNKDIPEDVNILSFPIRADYTKNGTLDGKVGLVNDPSYRGADLVRGSYFKPVQAYALKRQIERQSKQLEAYWDQFDAEGKGQSASADLSGAREDDPYYDWKRGVARRGIVNTYVWTAEGGLYKDEEEYASVYSESYAGEFEFKGMLGLSAEGSGAFFGVGLYAEADFLLGGHLEVTVLKKREDSRSFGIEVEVETDRFLKRWLGDASPEPYSKTPCPGKVNGYRFMTFYLPPHKSNADAFKGVVDDVWLARSDEPNAVALRELSYDQNGVWRVFHRVTYVSRVPPEFQPVPDESLAPPEVEPANVEDNLEIIQLVEQALGDDAPTQVNIGRAVNEVLDTALTETLPWWTLFLRAAEEFESEAQKTLRALRIDLLAYMNEAYATVLLEDLRQPGGGGARASGERRHTR
jgi:large repetitive protein